MGRVYDLEAVILRWGDTFASTVHVRGSLDGHRFRRLGTLRDAEGDVDTIPVAGRARWVRVDMNRRSHRTGFEVHSLEVLGREFSAPSKPAALVATPVAGQVAELRWGAAADDTGLLGYVVYREDTPIGMTCCPRYQDANLSPGSTHTYRVTALDRFLNQSVPSEPVTMAIQAESTPLLRNGDFEQSNNGGPEAWSTGGFQPSLAQFSWEQGAGRDGSRAVGIRHPLGAPNDTWWLQSAELPPGGHYNLVGWGRGEEIVGATVGANLAVLDGFTHSSDAGSTGTFDWMPLAVTFESDPSGVTSLQARLGFFASTVTGQAWFDDLSVPADSFAPAPLSRRFDLIVEREDRGAIDEASMQCWANHLDDAFDAYATLVGGEPTDGTSQQVLSVRQFPGGLAVAGNPIRWFHPFVQPELERIEANDDWSFAILHETSHRFDLDGRWVFQAELSANFKMVFVLDRLGGRVRAQGEYYEGPAIRDFFARRYEEAQAAGTFSWDAITYRMLTVVDAVGWLPHRKAYRDFLTLSDDELPQSSLAKFELFLDRVGAHAGFDVRSLWLPEELLWVEENLPP